MVNTKATLVYCLYLNKLNFDYLLLAQKHRTCYPEALLNYDGKHLPVPLHNLNVGSKG